VEIDGKPADVVEGAVTVPANKDIQIVAKKEGYEDIENETALMPGEDYSINLEFKRLAAGEEPAKSDVLTQRVMPSMLGRPATRRASGH